MAVIDYGAVVFKNGKRYQKERAYPVIFELGIIPVKCQLMTLDNKVLFCPIGDKVSWHFDYRGYHFHVKEVCPGVFKATAKKGNDFYQMVFGYGIDNDKRTWEKVKVRYLGKWRAKKVDKVLAEWGYE